MDLSEHNKKVAISRWSKIITKEKENINHNSVLKSALCGFLAGDGYIAIREEKKNKHYEIGFFPDDPIMLDSYCLFLDKIYHKKPQIRKVNKMFRVRLTSKMIVEDLMKLAKFGHYEWSLPKSIFSTNKEIISWLKAFFSAEAYVNPKWIRVQSVNKKSLKEVSALLDLLNIENKIYEYNPKQIKYSSVGIISIHKKEARKKYLETIGFWHSKKEFMLRKALDL